MTPDDPPDLKRGTCPKCNGTDVRVRRWGFAHGDWLRAGWLDSVRLHRYACAACGYLESYVKPNHLRRLRQTWARLEPAPVASAAAE